MANSIDQMISEAAEKGASVPAKQEATQLQPVSAGGQPVRKPSLDALQNSSMTVDNWLKVTEDGLKIQVENKSVLLDNLSVSINMQEVVATTAIKYGNPPQYFKTYDGLICADGATRWIDAIEQASRFAARPYDSADIPMTLNEDVKKGNEVLMTAGQRIGYSLSTTNKDAFAKFLRSVTEDGLREAHVDVKLGYEAKTNKNKQTWGIVTFENEGEHAE